MSKSKQWELSKEINDKAIEAIKKFYKKEKNEEIGDLAAIILMEFIKDRIAPIFYNQGIQDAIAYMNENIEDMYSLEII